MIFRLGYVAMTLNLENCSPSGTVTVTAFSRLPDREARLYRLRKIARENLNNTYRILLYNKAYDIKVYRFTSKLIPLANHPLTEEWDYLGEFADDFKKIGDFVKENDFRVSAHPDHYTLLNSPSDDVIRESVKDLLYHVKIYEAMGLSDFRYKLVLHVGGLYRDKNTSVQRFKENFAKLPENIKKRITLENDDKSYGAAEVLEICNEMDIPMVIDIHHHNCVNKGERISELLPGVFKTWDGEYFRPKVHFSSPKDQKSFRSHADYIDIRDFAGFLDEAKSADADFDVMLEAKSKDSALLTLSKQLEAVKGLRKLDESTFEIL